MKPIRRWLLVLLVAALAAPFVSIGGSPSLAQSSVDDEQVLDQPVQKRLDLERAAASGGISADRLVVLYQRATPLQSPVRAQVRTQSGGALLHADTAIDRDVLRVPNGDASAVAQRIRGLPGVRDAYADRVVSAALTVNDPLLGSEWGLTKIQAPAAWDTTQGSGVAVAVVDCGIHTSHPDLLGKVLVERNFSSSTTTDDRCNHGTHVAGTIGAVANNGLGVAGVAPAAKLINAKVLDDSGSGFLSDVESGITWAADNGARVINLSLSADMACPASTQSAADYAWGKGAVLVAAAGNSSGAGAQTPANCANVIGIAATDSADAKASFSNYGAEVDLAAPGVSVLSTVNPDVNGGTAYAYKSGTSMAAPHVSGVAALLWATSYGTGPAGVRDRLFSSADAIGGTGTQWTYGRVNAAGAVQSGAAPIATTPATGPSPTPLDTATPPPTPTSPPPTASATATVAPTATTPAAPSVPAAPSGLAASAKPGSIQLAWTASSTSGVSYNVYRGTVPGGTKDLIATAVPGTAYTDSAGLVKRQTYYYQVEAQSAAGVTSARSNEAVAKAR